MITPSREFIYPEDTTSAVEKIQLETNQYTDDDVFNNIENIAQKTYFQGVENYIDYLYEENNKSIFNYLPDNAIVVMNDISRLKERCENFVNEFNDNFNLNLEKRFSNKNQGNLIYSYDELPFLLENKNLIINSLLAKPVNGFSVTNIINFDSREVPSTTQN